MSMFSQAWDTIGDTVRFVRDLPGAELFIDVLQPWNWDELGDDIAADWSKFKHLLVPDMRRDREVQVQSSVNARTVVYGRTRVGNQIAYAESCGDKNETLHLICIHAGHEIDGYEEIYFDDKLVATAADGWLIKDPFTGKAAIEFFDGTQTAACASLIAASAGGWTVDHKLLGVAYTHITLTYDEAVYVTGCPSVKAVIRGKKVYDPRTGKTQWSDNPALCIRDYMLTAPEYGGMGCDPDEINEAAVITHANICDQIVYSNIALDYQNNPVTPGVKAVYKPVTGSAETRYTCNGVIKLDGAPTQFIKDMLTSCAGEAVYTGGEWKIYAGAPSASVATLDESWLNGGISFQTGAGKNDKNNSAKGTFTNSNDYWADTEFPPVPVGISTPPNATYWNVVATPSKYNPAIGYATGQYVTWASKVYLSYNTVPVNTEPPSTSYWSLIEEHDNSLQYPPSHTVQRGGVVYISTTTVPVSNPYIAEDGGEVLEANLSLPFTITSSEAQRLAKIALEKSRRGFSLSYPCNHKAFKLEPMDVVKVNNTRMGWVEKEFIVTSWPFSLMGGIGLSLNEYDPQIWDWSVGDSTPLVPPTLTGLPDPYHVAPPTDLTLTPRVYDTNNGASTRVDLIVSWQAGQASSTRYQVQYTLTDPLSADYGIWRDIGAITETNATIEDLAAGTYSVQVRGLNSLGAVSIWVTASVDIPNPDTVVPDITGLEIFGQGNDTEFIGRDVKLRWNKVSPRTNDVATGPASPNQYPGWFRYYELKILDQTGSLLRNEYLNTEAYNYDFEKNYSDTGRFPARTLTVEVRAVATWGDLSAIPARITVSNPAPPVPTGITATAFIASMSVAFNPLDVPDLAGYEIHASQTPGFTPSGHESGTGTCINAGPESSFFQKLNTFGTWYIIVGAYDTFSTDAINYSDPVSAFVEDLQVMPEQLFSTARTDFYLRDTTFLFGDIDPTTGVVTNATRLTWDAGFIDRADRTYTLTAGVLADGSDSYIIATLSEGTPGGAVIRQAAFGEGLPAIAANEIILAVTTSDPLAGTNNYVAYVRQANSAMFEGAYVRNATITDAKISGTLSANRITTLNGGVVITDKGLSLSAVTDTATGAASTASSAASAASMAQSTANAAALTAAWGSVSSIPVRFKDTPVGAGLSITPTNMGYYNGSAWKTYMDSTGAFYLSGSSADNSLTWNGTTLTVRGDITANKIQTAATTTTQCVLIDKATNDIKFYGNIDGTVTQIGKVGVFTATAGSWTGAAVASFGNLSAGNYTNGVVATSGSAAAIYAASGSSSAAVEIHNVGTGKGLYVASSGASSWTVSAANTAANGVGVHAYCSSASALYAVDGNCENATGYDIHASGNGINGPFTGAHDALIVKGSIPVQGDIMRDVATVYVSNISNTLSEVVVTTTAKDPAVFGVMVATKPLDENHLPTALKLRDINAELPDYDTIIATYDELIVNALGEGAINVCKEGGNIAVGDYICSSNHAGKGMKQDDDLMHNYTVAKARESVVWLEGEDDIRMIACTYHCG